MHRLGLIALISLVPISRCNADVYLNAGDSVEATFSSMFIPSVPTSGWVVQHGTEKLFSGSEYRISFFENSIDDPPILQQLVVGSTSGLDGFAILGYDNQGHWQDMQGAVRIDMISGSVSIQDVAVGTQINGQEYLQFMTSFSSVPEPSTSCLFLVSALVVLPRRKRNPGLGTLETLQSIRL